MKTLREVEIRPFFGRNTSLDIRRGGIGGPDPQRLDLSISVYQTFLGRGRAEAANSRTKKGLELRFNQVQISFTSE
jgi:hypothetical protein